MTSPFGPGPDEDGALSLRDERSVYAGTLVVLLVASAIGLAVAPATSSQTTPSLTGTDSYQVTDDGTRYTIHPSELQQGCPGGTDCIPSIDDPDFQSAAAATWLNEGDLVIGVEIDGQARAYPLRILNVHEIVNDRIAGRPVAVTYCPLCRSGLVFSRRVGNETLTFGVSGKLIDANLVMYDRQTRTYWSQVRGEAIVGPLVPTDLEIVPSTITTWEEWRRGHPETRVLSRNTGIYPTSTYASNPYAGYANRSGVGFGVDDVDERLPAKEVVYGVSAGGNATAYPADTVSDETVINDRVGDVPVAVVEHPTDGSVAVFVRRVDGKTLQLSAENGALVDQHGHSWHFDGTALDGPHEGTSLERIPTHGFYWFAWTSVHPETRVHQKRHERLT